MAKSRMGRYSRPMLKLVVVPVVVILVVAVTGTPQGTL